MPPACEKEATKRILKFSIRNSRSVEHGSSYIYSYIIIKEDFFFLAVTDDVISTFTDPSALCCSSKENVH